MRKLIDSAHSNERSAREFESNILRLLPWIDCWLSTLLDGESDEATSRFSGLLDKDLKGVGDYNTPFVYLNSMAEIATRIMTLMPRDGFVSVFEEWYTAADRSLTRSRLVVARIATRSPQLQAFGLKVVSRGLAAAQLDRTDADTRVESLIDLAQTILAVNETEAFAIFDNAVVEARQVGDDLYARWETLAYTAKALGSGGEDARAYRLHQIAEALNREFGELDLVRLVERLRAMHEPTLYAESSRSRDRRTLAFDLMLTPAFRSAGAKRISPLALYTFRPRTEWKKTVAGLASASAEVAGAALEEFTRYERAVDETPRAPSHPSGFFGAREHDSPTDLAEQFAETDYTSEDAWNIVLNEIGWAEGKLIAAFALDAEKNRRPEVVGALGRATKAHMADFVAMAQAASACDTTPALRSALERLAVAMATRFASNISTWIWEADDINIVAEAAGMSADQLLEVALREIGSSADEMSYAKYLQLAARIATTLDVAAAGRLFDALAELFEDLSPSPTTSDGPFALLPPPPASFSACVAGVIWAVLSDISIEMRWCAANAVLLLVRLGCDDELEALLRLADATHSPAPFVESRFPFYSLHARMWLLLALARATLEANAAAVDRFAPFLASVILSQNHAANQVLAQRVLAKLVEVGSIAAEGPVREALDRRVVADCVEMDWRESRGRADSVGPDADEADDSDDRRFCFDFESFWCNRVADVFGHSEGDIARRAAKFATGLSGYELFATESDPRSEAGIYDERDSYPSRGSWPAQEHHSFYVAVHALLGVASKLAESELAYKTLIRTRMLTPSGSTSFCRVGQTGGGLPTEGIIRRCRRAT